MRKEGGHRGRERERVRQMEREREREREGGGGDKVGRKKDTEERDRVR